MQQALMIGGERFLPEPRNTRGWPRNHDQLTWALLVVRDGLSWIAASRQVFGEGAHRGTGGRLARRLGPFLAHLQERKNALAEREFDATNDRVLREVSSIALADRISFTRPVVIKGLTHWIGKPVDQLTPMQRIAVHSWTTKVVTTDDGDELDFRYRLHGKGAALEFLGKHLGMLSEHMLMEMISRRAASSIEDYTEVPTEDLQSAIDALEAVKEKLKTSRAIDSTVVPG